MATKVKRSKKSAAAKPKATAKRRTREDLVKLVPGFVKHLQGGGTMRALKQEHDFSSDHIIRKTLAEEGYDAKGNKLDISPIKGSGAALAKKVAAERKRGEAFYVLALRTGKSEADLKKLLKEHGHDALANQRVYVKKEKAAKAGR